MCDNEPCFERGESVPIPPLPPVATIKKCPQKNHHKCYTKSLKSNEMFAHSVEALVVWVVESEAECSFEEYTAQKLTATPVASPSTPTTATMPRTPPPRTPPPSISQPPRVSPAPVPPKQTFKSPTPPPSQAPSQRGLYRPEDVMFATISDIPPRLLSGVAECYKKQINVCRVCFFDSGCKSLVLKIEVNRVIMCPHGHNPWREIRVIPKCELCVSPSEWIPLPPLPKHMKQSRNPFSLCKKPDHGICYTMSKGTNPWFPHTVEEMVIWTVERERDVLFEDVYKEFLSPPILSGPDSTQPTRPKTTIPSVQPFVNTRTVISTEPKHHLPNNAHGQPLSSQKVTPKAGSWAQLMTSPPMPSVQQSAQRKGGPPVTMTTNRPTGVTQAGGIQMTSNEAPVLNKPAVAVQIKPHGQTTTAPASVKTTPKAAAASLPTTVTVTNQPVVSEATYVQTPSSKTVPTNFDMQSPTMSMDLEEAIKLANLPPSTQSAPPEEPSLSTASNMNSVFGAFPNLLTNILPEANGVGGAGGYGSLAYGSFSSMPDHALGGLFPALFGGSEGLNLGTGDPFANLGPVVSRDSTTSATYRLPVSTALEGWNNAPASESHDVNRSSSVEPTKSGANVQNGQNSHKPQANSTQLSSTSAEPVSNEEPGIAQDNSLVLPRMPNSEPMVLEKALEADGFIKVKSKRQKKKVNPSFSASQSNETVVSRPKFSELELDDFDNSGMGSGNESEVKTGPSPNSQQSSGAGSSYGLKAASAVSLGTASQSPLPKQRVEMSNGVSTSNGAPDDVFEHFSGTFDPQPNGFIPQTTVTSSDDGGSGSSVKHIDLSNACMVCYESFSDVQLLMAHCQSESHCSAVAMTTGGTTLPKFCPPHLDKQRLKICKKSECPGAPACKRAHSQQQLVSWKQEWAPIRSSRTPKKDVRSVTLPPPVKLIELTNGLQLSSVTANSQYPMLVVSLSSPSFVTVQHTQEKVEWGISLQGQSWQTLFGIYCHTPSTPGSTSSRHKLVFKVKSISSGTRTVFVDDPIWEAKSMGGGFLLGRVVVCVEAWVDSARELEECELQLNLGYKEFPYLPLTIKVEGRASVPTHERSQPTLSDLNDQPTTKDVEDPLRSFVPVFHGSSSSEELGMPNIEGEDTTLQHVPIEDWGYSLTEDTNFL